MPLLKMADGEGYLAETVILCRADNCLSKISFSVSSGGTDPSARFRALREAAETFAVDDGWDFSGGAAQARCPRCPRTKEG